MTNNEKAFRWLLFMTFTTGFVLGQEYHTGFWLVVRFLFQLIMWGFVLIVLYQTVTHKYTRKQEDQWKDHPFQPKPKPSSKGAVVTAAAVAQAIGTHVTVLEPEKQSASSGECRHAAGMHGRAVTDTCGDLMCLHCYPEHPSRPGFKPDEG